MSGPQFDVPSDALRDQLLEAMLAIAPFEGWTDHSLIMAARDAGLSEGEAALAAPDGVSDLLRAFSERADAEAVAQIKHADLAGMKVRDRITFAVRARIEALSPHKEAARRAAEAAAAPWRAGLAAQLVWRAADRIWAAVGDTSTDFNWYSKRAILSGVLGSTLATWFGSEDDAKAWRRLDAHINNVMRFETTKARVKKAASKAPNPMDLFGRRRGF